MEQDLINVYDCEKQCEYKGRRFAARDNGAIMRYPRDGYEPNFNDNKWTFGTKNESTGYMMFTSAIRVHQVVCTAFHGPAPYEDMVVDHIDTNRCNNRPENLRWLTRLDNALENPITRRKIILCCGSIENFLKNPAMLRENANEPNFAWMRTVTKAEASRSLRNLTRWAAQDGVSTPKGQGVGDWIFGKQDPIYKPASRPAFPSPTPREMSRSDFDRKIMDEMATGYFGEEKPAIRTPEEIDPKPKLEDLLSDSLTPGAKQLKWRTPTEFLLCPGNAKDFSLLDYYNNLKRGKLFLRNEYSSKQTVLNAGYNKTEEALYVLTYDNKENPVGKHWALCKIYIYNDVFVHESQGTFFEENGGLKYFTEAMGQEWTGGEVIDDYC